MSRGQAGLKIINLQSLYFVEIYTIAPGIYLGVQKCLTFKFAQVCNYEAVIFNSGPTHL